MGLRDERVLVFDGACGSGIQAMGLSPSAWDGRYEGCNEYLNLSAPAEISRLHRSFLDVGARVVETNTFGATRTVLEEYGLGGRVAEINAAAVRAARDAVGSSTDRYVAGSIGPTTKLPSLGQIACDDMRAAYSEQIGALLDAGVDLLIVETCQDLLQAKIAVVCAFDEIARRGAQVPVMLSVTVETTGTLLVGTPLEAVVATFEPFPLFSLGINCATGPEEMPPSMAALSRLWTGRLSVMPNAGMPEMVDGETRYPLEPESFARALAGFVERDGATVVGGCCGTRPEHIRALCEALDGVTPARRDPAPVARLSSLYGAVDIEQIPRPLVVGERTNASGSRRFRKRILSDDFEGAARIGVDQEAKGAHVLDLCTAQAGRDEAADMSRMVELLARTARSPLVLDSTSPEVLEAALSRAPGRCVVNSINLEDGGRTAGRVLDLVKRYGAAVVCLTIGPEGMAMTAGDKLAVARSLHDLAVDRYGLNPEDLFFDPLTFTLGSGDPDMRRAAVETLEAIPLVEEALPGVHTWLGVSNVSYGLPPHARKRLNSVFLAEALRVGLDAAIVDPGKILPLASISDEDREVCLDLIRDRRRADGEAPLDALIAHFSRAADDGGEKDATGVREPEDELAGRILSGDKEDVEDLVAALVARHPPASVVSRILVPAMRKVGDLFGKGEMLLPFVLQSAEVMKAAVRAVEPYMDRSEERPGPRVLLATVQGDVHDIGKNLVAIILENNGYEVVDVGTNAPVRDVVQKAREHRVGAIGLSGLLVKSALAMRDCLAELEEEGFGGPVLLGGAALTSRFVAESLAPMRSAPVVYCADAFEGLRSVQEMEAGTLRSTAIDPAGPGRSEGRRSEEAVRPAGRIPEPPFLGGRATADIPPEDLFDDLNEAALLRVRWGFKRAGLSAEEHAEILEREARPALADLRERVLGEGLLEPATAWGYFSCRSEGDDLLVDPGGADVRLSFPRQTIPPHLCVADFFSDGADGPPDVVGLFAVTVGPALSDAARALYAEDRYRDYLLLHGLGSELADALAGMWHRRMREELRIGSSGARWAFGYPACPGIEAHADLFRLLPAERIGMSLADGGRMIPELSTSALVAHHPEARYFAV